MAKLTKADFLDLYRLLAKTRALNETLIIRRNKFFGAALNGIRQEAVSVAPMFALLKAGILKESIKSGDHRTIWGEAVVMDELTADEEGHNHTLEVLRNHFLKSTGGNRGRDGNVHWGCIDCRILPFMASDMGRMPGIALGFTEETKRLEWPSIKSKNKRPVGIAFFGEGAAQQGGIHEAMNWAAASNHKRAGRGAPFIFVIVKNQRSLFADGIDEHGDSDLAARANGYADMVGVDVDGDNPIEMYDASIEAVKRAQNLTSTLIVANTYRGTGHNQDQIEYEKGAVEAREWWRVKRVFGVEDIEKFKAEWKREPLRQLREHIVDSNIADEETLDGIMEEQRRYVDALADQVLAEPGITIAEDKKDRTIFPPINWADLPLEKPYGDDYETQRMGYNKAFAWIVGQLMREDERVVYLGEDVGEGGVLGYTRGLVEEFGRMRIWNATLSEEAIAANAAGRALYGSKPICEFQFSHFWWDGAVIYAVIAPQWYQKGLKFGFTSIFPGGVVRGGGSGDYHEAWQEGVLVNLAGITVVAPSNAYDLVGHMRAAHEFDGPVAVMLQISAANLPEFENFAVNYATGEIDKSVPQGIPLEPYVIPFGKAKILREGSDFTVVSYGAAAVSASKNEADFLEKEDGISVEVIDLRTVHPTDFDAIKESVQKTGRLAIMHAATRPRGAGTYIKSELMEDEGFLEYLLTRKVEIVAAGMEGDLFTPTARDLVWARLPYYTTEVEMEDEKGRKIKRDIHRSSELAAVIKDSMRYK